MICGEPRAHTAASKPVSVLKVMGVRSTSMGDVAAKGREVEVASHLDPAAGIYKKLVLRDGVLVGAVLLGADDPGGLLRRLFSRGEAVTGTAVDLLTGMARDAC